MVEHRGYVLVTGASSGMGRACALELSAAGITVFAGVRRDRDAQLLSEEDSDRIIPVILDVTKRETISAVCRTIDETVGTSGLAGVVNNAGVGVTGPIELVPLEELRRQYEINVIGQVAVIQSFLPLVRRARGRIVNVGSVGARFALPFGGPLCSSKAAFESISDSLRMELRRWGIRVIVVSPGSIRTPAVDKLVAGGQQTVDAFPGSGRELYASSYLDFVGAFQQLESDGVAPAVMARAVFHALTSRTPRKRYPVGPKSRLLPLLAALLPTGALDLLRTRIFHVYRRFGADEQPGTSRNPSTAVGP